MAIDKEVYGERHPNVARDLNNIGTLIAQTVALYKPELTDSENSKGLYLRKSHRID